MEIKEFQDELKKAIGKRIVGFEFSPAASDSFNYDYATLEAIILEDGLSIGLGASDYGSIVMASLVEDEMDKTNAA